MELACPCFNVQLRLPLSPGRLREPRDDADSGTAVAHDSGSALAAASGCPSAEGLSVDAFFAASLAIGSFAPAQRRLLSWGSGLGVWAEGRKFPSLVALRSVAAGGGGQDWEVVRCQLCDTDLWAKPTRPAATHFLLVNACLPSGAEIQRMAEHPDFSVALGIRLLQENREVEGSGASVDGYWSSTSTAAHQVQASVSEYLRGEQEAMEGRVRAYVEAEHHRFELLRKEAKRHRDAVLRDLQARNLIKDPNAMGPLEAAAGLRLRSGSGGGSDSAVPLSPVSLVSLSDPSPAVGIVADRYKNAAWNAVVGSEDSGLGGGLKSGGSQELGPEDEDQLFSLDEDVGFATLPPPTVTVDAPPPAPLPPCLADDEAETDDSGNGEDVRRFLRESGPVKKVGGARPCPGAGRLVPSCGKSLPVRVPCRFWPPKDAVGSHPASSSEDEEHTDTGAQIAVKPRRADHSGKDGRRRDAEMAESMRKLARSIQAADDPERIFGEFPARRRYKTGTREPVVRMRHSGRTAQAFPTAP